MTTEPLRFSQIFATTHLETNAMGIHEGHVLIYGLDTKGQLWLKNTSGDRYWKECCMLPEPKNQSKEDDE